MKIITWNCNMAFRKKAEIILAYEPDILIVAECEHPDKLIFKSEATKPTDMFWFGKNQNKGLAVFTFGNLKISLLDCHNPDFAYILPLNVSEDKSTDDQISLTLLAIWAQKPLFHDCYTEQIWNAVHFYSQLLDGQNVVLAGDFNSNSIWDKPNRVYNHTSLVEFLKTKDIVSTYHHFHHQAQGQERDKTLFMHRKTDRSYHIDFCFASKALIDKLTNVEVGTYHAWTNYSDHKPVMVEFDHR